MIDKIIAYSVKKPLSIVLMVLALMAWGGYSLYTLPVDAVPDVTSNQVDVITNSPSLAAIEIEKFITAPIEMAMSNIPGLVEIRSTSKFGLSVVKIVLDDDVDIYWARQQVFERLDAVQSEIPAELGKPYMGPVSTGLGEVYQYVIRPSDPQDHSFSLMEIRTLQDWVIRKQLLGIPGIAEVSGFGGKKKEYTAAIIPERMRALGVSIDELFHALNTGNSNTGGAYIEKYQKAFTIRGIGLANGLADIGNTVIKINAGLPVLVRDVADVQLGNSIRYGAINMNGTGEVVGGIVMMMKGANGIETIGRIKEKMKVIEKNLPEGLIIEPFIDREKLVSKAIQTVTKNLMEGALIVVLVIIIFLGNWRASIIAASVIPLSMLFAFGMMRQFDVVGNLMSLGAIDFGLLVDPAIIIVESVVMFLAVAHHKFNAGHRLTYAERQEEVIEASGEVKKSVVYGGLIILIVYFPLLTLTGVEGKMFIPMAKTVGFAIMGALMLSITYVPMMSSLLLRPPKDAHGHGISGMIVDAIYRIYEPVLRYFLSKKYIAISLAFLVLVGGFLGFRSIGGEFIPKLAEGDLVIETNLPVGASLSEAIKLGDKIQAALLEEFPDEVERVVSKIGTSEVPVDPMPLEAQEIVVVLHDKSHWKKADNQEDLTVLVAKVMDRFPGIVVSIQQPIENRVNELMSGARTDVVVKLFGEDLDTLVNKGNQIIDIIKGIDGAVDVQENKIFGLPQININYNRARMAFYGVTVSQINRTIQTAFAGSVAGIVYENDKRFDLTLRLSSEERDRAENISNLLISDKDGNPVPLKQVADITENIGPSEIAHEDLKRKVNIGFNIRGRDLESVVNDARTKIEASVVIPPGYGLEYGGEFENFSRAKKRLAIVVPVALLVIFGLLYSTFGNFKDSLLIYAVVPLSAVGGVFSLLIRDMNFSISAGVGFIALFGVAVLNGILLVSQFKLLEKSAVSNLKERVLIGVKEKFRPVLMTSIVAALGFLPMALSNSAGAEVQKPLATVVIGGLFTATLLTLLVLPVLYTLFNKPYSDEAEKIKKGIPFTVILLLLLALPGQGISQKRLSLDSAVFLALANNPEVKLAEQRLTQQKRQRSAAISLDAPMISVEAPNGTEFKPGVIQTFAFPGVYSSQWQEQKARVDLATVSRSISKNELLYKVRTAYNQILFLTERVKLLTDQDSIYDDILFINEVRYKVGQISMLEKVNGDAQYQRIRYNLSQAKAELRNARIQFSLLLGFPNDTSFVPTDPFIKSIPGFDPQLTDTSFYSSNPNLKYSLLNQKLQGQALKTQRRRLYPGLMVGYLDQGERETPLDLRLQAGVTLPIWQWFLRGHLNAAKEEVGIAVTQTTITRFRLNTEYSAALSQYRQYADNLAYFETAGLLEANSILNDARESYRLGSIGYYHYLQNLELAFQIRYNYLESIRNYNQSIYNLEYLKGTE